MELSLTTGFESHDSDAEVSRLLKAAGTGDPSAWREIVRLYARRLFALAKSRCRNDDTAEEITQSVLATVAVKVGGGEYVDQGRFESWLFRVAMNRVRDHVRRAKRRPETQDHEAMELRGSPEPGEQSDPGMMAKLRDAMERLADADREIIELRHHGGLSFKQMAEMLNEPVGTLLARHHRALRKLKELMETDTVATRGRN